MLLVFTKFFYGFAIPTLIYLGMKKTSFKKLAINDFFVVLIYMIFVVGVGWLAGKGFKLFLAIFQSLQMAVFFLVIFIIFLVVLKKWLSIRFMSKQKQLK